MRSALGEIDEANNLGKTSQSSSSATHPSQLHKVLQRQATLQCGGTVRWLEVGVVTGLGEHLASILNNHAT